MNTKANTKAKITITQCHRDLAKEKEKDRKVKTEKGKVHMSIPLPGITTKEAQEKAKIRW